MADNYLQRSHRQDDSRFGNDDPLMELSRIMGTPDEEDGLPSGSGDDFALDLERELMGGFDDDEAPQPTAAPIAAERVQAQSDEEEARLAAAFQRSIESDLSASEAEASAGQHLAAYEEPDYGDYEPEASYVDDEAGEGGELAAGDASRPAAGTADPAFSLEDELHTLLAGSAEPVADTPAPVADTPAPVAETPRPTVAAPTVAAPTIAANASWGYGSRSHVAGRLETAPVISRATPYQAPEALDARAVPAGEPIQQAMPALDEAAPEDTLDTEELMAAFDDFELTLDAEEDENGAAPEQSAQVYGNGPVEQIAVPVAAPIASAPKLPDVHDLGDYAEELDRAAASAARAAPDVDTIAVTENRVDYTEALDLPAVNYEDDAPAHQGMGELETEFAEVFGSIEAETPPSTLAATEESQKADPEQDEYADIFADVFGNEAEQERYSAAAGIAAGGVAAAPVQARTPAAAYRNGPEHDADFGYDPRQDTVDIAAAPHVPAHARARRSALFVPGVAAAVVLVAVAGAVAYKWTGSNGGEPVVIMADKTPIKVKPETTGSTAVPNQDKAVYDKSATSTPTAPEQDKLVTTREDPVDLAAGEEDDTPVADNDDTPAIDKVEERVDPADQDVAANEPAAPGGNNALAPRKVQTMVVKPDGTMVASIGNGSEALSSGPAAAPAERPAAATTTGPSSPVESGNDAIGSLVDAAPADAIPAEAAAPALAPAAPQKSPVAAKPVETRNVTPKTTAAAAPKNVPMVESRPAEQPLDIVDRVPGRNQQAQASAATQQVASVAPAGSYLIQISSQPTVEGAQKSYASLSQRYPSVIGGRGVDIKQAEIAGKGTFYRVRIPAGSKSEAANLCSKYKSAGGSCFVTR